MFRESVQERDSSRERREKEINLNWCVHDIVCRGWNSNVEHAGAAALDVLFKESVMVPVLLRAFLSLL
jgi:hypothetical protein